MNKLAQFSDFIQSVSTMSMLNHRIIIINSYNDFSNYSNYNILKCSVSRATNVEKSYRIKFQKHAPHVSESEILFDNFFFYYIRWTLAFL